MKLPNAAHAEVRTEKLTHYLLSLSHPEGWSKALFFRRLGYNEDNAARLGELLQAIAEDGRVVESLSTPFGTKYIVDGLLTTLDSREVLIRTVWMVEAGGDPRFVTAYPRRPPLRMV